MQGVSVDDDFARFGAKSYAINKITSVEVRERRPHELGCAVGLFVLAGFSVLAAFSALPLILLAAVLGGLGYWQYKRSKIVEYQLFLITSAAETQAFVTRDADEVAALREQIEGAMARSSRGG